MKRWAIPLAILAAGLLGTVWYELARPSRASFPAPDFALPDLTGRVHRLSDLRGKVVFLNLWTTWCPPCREEMPSMESLHRRFKSGDLVMLAVNQDEGDTATVRTFVDGLELSFPILIDPQGTLSRQYGVTGYPETFVIDRQGLVVEHFIGPEEWDSEQAQQYFATLLGAG